MAEWQEVVTPTVLILGAGASHAYGFPLGDGLTKKICALSPDLELEAFGELGIERDELNDFVSAFRFSGYSSVDWFLEKRPEFSRVGRATIARCLIPCEDARSLFPPNAPSEHWYEVLLNQLDERIPFGEMGDRGVSILTFNYDRSLEYYLLRALATRRGSQDRAVDEMRRLPIVHLHGSLGGLPPLHESGRHYHTELTPDSLNTAMEDIVVVGEAEESSERFQVARDLIDNSERVLFLGFGFNQSSLARLQLIREQATGVREVPERLVSGTSRRLPDPTWQFVTQHVMSEDEPRFPGSIHKFLTNKVTVGPTLRPAALKDY